MCVRLAAHNYNRSAAAWWQEDWGHKLALDVHLTRRPHFSFRLVSFALFRVESGRWEHGKAEGGRSRAKFRSTTLGANWQRQSSAFMGQL